jgi:recombination protein RecT
MAKDLMVVKKETADLVLSKVQHFQKNGELDLPPNYSAANALKSAWLILQATVNKDKKPALEVCTKHSIANAMLDTVIQGLNPAKKQCYYIVYGNQLTMQRSYQGTKAVCMRVDKSLEDIYAEVVYKGDKLEYRIERGRRIIENHTQKLENINDDNILAAYAVAIDKEGNVKRSELMTLDQLKQAWKQSKMYPINDKGDIKGDSTHGKFTAEMAKKTVTNRMSKHIIGTSDDSDLVIQSVRRTDDDRAQAEAQAEVEELANQGDVIDIESPEPAEKEDRQEKADPPTSLADESLEPPEEVTGGPGF